MEQPHEGLNDLEMDYERCVFCQKKSKEKLTDPTKLSRSTDIGKSYSTLANDLKEFDKTGHLHNSLLKKLVSEHGDNIESFLKASNVKWHKNCRRKLNSDKLKDVLEKSDDNDKRIDLEYANESVMDEILKFIRFKKKLQIN